MKVKRSPNRVYKITLEDVGSKCLLGKISEPTKLWHARMGHVSFPLLKLMADKEMVQGIPRLTHPKDFCEGYLVGK